MRFIRCGHCVINSVQLLITIDEDTYIGPYVCIAGPGDIKIGKACLIAPHSGIFANNHIFADPTRRIGDQGVTRKGIVIKDDCWLGHNVTVLDGVTIGKGSIIGAGSVVSKDIPPYSIAVGAPARVIKSRCDNFDTPAPSVSRILKS
ncbi:MAG: acyltransferase [Scytonema sp. RU_4_4]|nr:acyltransferase [Scytonema sp. RU_4_4]NJR73779.1 acyltransferase [Scytonema sp. CRU_2_7]